jgi:O-antigen/teichoic acid export membrane protein
MIGSPCESGRSQSSFLFDPKHLDVPLRYRLYLPSRAAQTGKASMKDVLPTTAEASITTKNISLVAFLRLTQYPFLLCSAILIPRMMGPEIYGDYALLLSIMVITASLLELGQGEIFGRFIPEFQARHPIADLARFSSNFLGLKCLIDFLACIILFLVIQFLFALRYSVIDILLIILTALAIDIGGIFHALVFGLNKLGKHSSRDLIRRPSILILVLILFPYFGLSGAILGILAVEIFLAVLYLFWTSKYFSVQYIGISLSFLYPYMQFGLLFYILWMLFNTWQKLGNILIQFITKNPKEVAFFDISNQFFLIISNFSLVTIYSFVPIFTQLHINGKEWKVVEWSNLIIKYMAIFCTIAFWSFIITGPDLVTFILGHEYNDVFRNAAILLPSIFPMAIAQLSLTLAIVYKEPRKYIAALFFAICIFLLFCSVLIPKYASLGCAIASFSSCLAFAGVLTACFRAKLLPCLNNAMKIVGFGFLPAFLLLFKGSLAANLLLVNVFILGYLLLLFKSNILNSREIREILQAIKR